MRSVLASIKLPFLRSGSGVAWGRKWPHRVHSDSLTGMLVGGGLLDAGMENGMMTLHLQSFAVGFGKRLSNNL